MQRNVKIDVLSNENLQCICVKPFKGHVYMIGARGVILEVGSSY